MQGMSSSVLPFSISIGDRWLPMLLCVLLFAAKYADRIRRSSWPGEHLLERG
jgi:hypothetical protein